MVKVNNHTGMNACATTLEGDFLIIQRPLTHKAHTVGRYFVQNELGVATLERRVDKSGNSPESPTTWARRDGRAKTLMRPDMRTRPCMRDILISPVFVHL